MPFSECWTSVADCWLDLQDTMYQRSLVPDMDIKAVLQSLSVQTAGWWVHERLWIVCDDQDR